MAVDYTTVTEITGCNVTAEQVRRMYSRYRFASELCSNKDCLEVACGSGQGLGYLTKAAKRVVGGDCDWRIVDLAHSFYRERASIGQLDAHALPFKNGSFDVVILYEAIYYLTEPERFIEEAYRVLRDEGTVILCTANKDWPGFNPSPHSRKYFSAPELADLLNRNKFQDVKLFGQCLARDTTIKGAIIAWLKQGAVALNLMPKTMKGKELFKRIFMGRLMSLPAELQDGLVEYIAPSPIPSEAPNTDFKVLFAVATRPVTRQPQNERNL